jgi:hypothetical protein
MSFVTTHPEIMSAAAFDLQGIGSQMAAGNAAVAGPTTGVLAPAADEVSGLAAAQFATHAAMYQTVSAQAAAIHQMFTTALGNGAGSYASAEAANVAAAALGALQ